LVATGLLVLTGLLVTPLRAHAVLGVGDTVFDPTMYATQLLQLEQATATVTNLTQQLQYAVQNTTGGSAGIWQSNQTLLTNLGSPISQQEGLSYGPRTKLPVSSSPIRASAPRVPLACRVHRRPSKRR
jgi:hypothetical protein